MAALLLHDALRGAFSARSGATAIDQEGARTTYGELAALARRLAARVLALSTPEDRFVGVSAAVTRDSIAAIVGALQAGKAYVPLDVQSPPARLGEIIADARLRVLLIDPLAYPAWRELARRGVAETIVLLGAEAPADAATLGPRVVSWSEVLAQPDEPAPPPHQPILADDLAYILYTSGSTGAPKGVMLTHRNARTFVDWMGAEFAVGPDDRVAARAPLNFDLSVFDVFNTLAAGAALLIKDRRSAVEAGQSSEQRHRAYVEMLSGSRATVLYTTPSTLVALLDKGGLDARAPLRQIMYAGEPFPPALLRRLMLTLPRTRVANIYGPTETNIVTCHHVESPPADDAPIPIGREVDDTEILVVGDDGRLAAPGAPGELWVRGGTVCVGYFGKDELTRERLVDSPFHPYPARFWRTGDQGLRRDDGVLVYHGRIDSMVKVRGYRIELGDIESALAAHPGVAQGIVLPVAHATLGNELHALVVLRDTASLSPDEVIRYLAERLPQYMLPRTVVITAELPYTSTGKVDRQLLLASIRR
jgi:amino acid adenylation domain-containing protein